MPKSTLKGIKGWLLFYVIFLSFRLIVIISILLIYQKVYPIILIEAVFVVLALLSIFIKYYPKQVNIIYLLLSIITTIIVNANGIRSDVIEDRAGSVGAIMGATVVSVIFILYWIKSKRINNTFTS